METKYTGIYLNDHLAGSSFGLELAERIAKQNEGNDYGKAVEALSGEIAEDRDKLEQLMKALGVRRKIARQVLTWASEKAARLKPNGKLVGYSPLSRYMELEMLSLGVAGKLSLWEALIEAAGPEVEGIDVEALAARARDQRKRLEALRLQASPEVFGSELRPSGSSATGRAAVAAR